MILKNFKSLLVTMVTFAFGMGIVHAQTLNWTGEDYTKNFSGYYYIKCFSGNKFMAANGTNGKLVSGHTNATVFTFDYQQNDTYDNEFNISYDNNGQTNYINSNKTSGKWGTSSNKWNFNWVESKSGYTFNRRDSYIWLDDTHFTITYNYSKNSIAYAETNANDYADDSRVWQLISVKQVEGTYPANISKRLEAESQLTGIKYALVKGLTYSTIYDDAESMWLTKQHLTATSTSFTVTGINNEKYILEIYAKKTGSGTAKIVANGVYSEPLTEQTKLYQLEVPVTSNKITVSFDTTDEVDACFTLKAIASQDDIESRNMITWSPEEAQNGSYYLKRDTEDYNAYLTAISSVKDDIENSTLFGVKFSDATKKNVELSYDNNGITNYVFDNGTGRSSWGTQSMNWLVSVNSLKYTFSSGSGRDTYFIQSDGKGVQYTTNKKNNTWQFISKKQHDDISARSLEQSLSSLGKNVRAYWQTPIKTSLVGDRWYAYTNEANTNGASYNQIKIVGLTKKSYYLVEVEGRRGNVGNANIYVEGQSEPLTGNLETYYIPVYSTYGNITVRVQWNSDVTGEVWSAVKSITPMTDNGVPDDIIKNPYFAIHQTNAWSKNWSITNYSRAVAGYEKEGSLGYEGNGFYAVQRGKTSNYLKDTGKTTGRIYQKLTSLPAGIYTLSADVVSKNCKSTLFISKTNNVDIWSLELSDIDTKTNKSITFFVPEPIIECRVGYKYVVDDFNDDEVISAVDNFRLIRQTNADKGVADAYLTNAYFAMPQGQRTWDYGWTNNGFSPSICGGENGFEGSGLCAERTGCNNNDGETHRISQVVNLPKGTYVLSADVIAMDRIGHIYAKVGNETFDQFCYGPESRYTLEFNIQESTDVEVGFYSDVQGVNYGENNSQYLGPTWDNDVTYRVAVDNFRLISSDDYLENADFSDGWNHWAHTENATISLVEGLGHGNYVQTNTVWESNSTGNCIYANDINQTVSLPAGAYQLSANGATNNVITCLYAKIGDRMQRMYVPSSKWQTTNPQFTFIVPTASDVTVGLSFEKTYGDDVSVKLNYFHLIRIGDAEGTDITSQIVNANLLANNDGLPNDKYGWRTGTGKDFRTYDGATNLAEVFYNADGSTPDYETYKITQKINGLPDGWYRLTAQGFYRDGAGKKGGGTSNASSTFGFDDPDQARAHLIIGNYYTPIQSLYSENAPGTDDNGRPMWLGEAKDAFDQGYYNNNAVVGKAVNGVLEIGVRREDAIDHDWLCLNNFKLYYMYDENAFPEVAGSLKDPSFEENNNAKAWEPSFTNWVTVGNRQSINQTEYNNLSNTNYIGYGVREMADNEKSVYHGDYIFFAKNNYVQLTSGYNRYYKQSTKRTINIGQTVTDLPSGEYTLKAQVKVTSASNSKAHLSVTSNGETINAYSTSSNPEWLSVISDVGSDGKMTISLEMSLTTGDSILVDNFILEKTGGDVYVYNCEAGAFISTDVNKGLSKNPVSFSTTGAKLRMSARGVTEGMRSFEYNNQYLNVSNIVNGNSRYEYLTYETNATHNEFKVTTPEGSNISTICVNPADATFGTTANIVNAGSASAYNGKYGTTYMGWTGETGFDVVYPLIPENDKAGRGTKWRVLDESQYNKYKNTIAAAHEARMAAWPIYCSARRSTYSVDVTRFEDVYNNISSTAEAINKVAKELKVQLESELLLNNATVDDYVDVTYLVSDIDFKEATLNKWNNEGGKFVYSESTNHVTDKIFGGRHYAAISDDALGNAKLTVTIPNLRSGKYAAVLTVSAYAGGDEVEGVAAVAGDEEAFRSIDIEPTSYNIYNVVIPRFTVDDNHKNAVVGIKLTGTNATSVEIGNLTLRYLGPVHSAADDYDYTLDDNVLTYIGNWPVAYEAQEYFNYSLDANKNVRTIYLKEDGFATDFDMTFDADKFTNKNLLIYKKPGQENIHILNMTSNIVEGDECDEYVLVDKNDISIPEAFTAKKASYKRTGVTSNYGTLCLPFEFSMEDGTKLYDFGGFQANNGEINIIIEPVDKVEACRPCIFKKADSDITELNIEGNNVTISEAKPDTVDVDGFKLIGAFNKHTFGDITEQDKTAAIDYYYIAKDKFWHATDYFTNGAFRSYIYTGGKLEDIFGVHDVRSIGFYEFMDEEATSVDGVDSDSEIVGYYNLNGQQIDTPTSGVVIVKYSDGKYRKVMVKQK